ncbi:MAG: bifunctional DNA-formamidopyrimidine glycosylase/DNA-(apurinic or apyrimidinic site) lyase [bacterium]|nr:bifunctional DNA-formamidopyrimidine glycosylase/DNA-(apurinic or apyrimidinic site) lyase [bacterium]
MPELPEVEVLKRSLEPRLTGGRIRSVKVHEARLRERVRAGLLDRHCAERRVLGLRRRSKYLLVDLEGGHTLVIHLGMSGRLTLGSPAGKRHKHDHVTFSIAPRGRPRSLLELRFRDPRRFGLVLSIETKSLDRDRHFAHLGVEPLSGAFSGRLLAERAAGRRAPIKSFLMDARNVVGVGNIYVCEALFRAGIHPLRAAGRIALERWQALAAAIVEVLRSAIEQGGTTLNDFADGEGNPGYFRVALEVYGREGEPCRRCGRAILRRTLSNRSTFYCPGCQH